MDKNKIHGFMDQLKLFLIGAVIGGIIGSCFSINAVTGYLLFNASIILQMLFYGIWAIVVGIILIVLCLKAENHGNKV